tara:strand:+ start:715 stop:1410 length:696 start_codon:yes stop_codon:yes gene_type:complete
MKVYYRLSNQSAGGYKNKLTHATKYHCLQNAIDVFGGDNITIIGDRLDPPTLEKVQLLKLRLIQVNNGSGSGTFRDALDRAIDENGDDEVIYLLEDDFLHLDSAAMLIEEGVNSFNSYVTGYDHPDKYLNKEYGGNAYIESGGEVTRLVKSEHSHWKITNSTVMSFAASRKRLVEDRELLGDFAKGKITDSFGFFQALSQTKGISVLSPIPGVSTHVEKSWLSPFTNWTKV